MPQHIAAVAAGLLAFSGAAPADDDRIELHNGDIISGRITEQAEEHVTIEHPVLGELTLQRDQIASISTTMAEPDEAAPPTEAELDDAEEDESPRWKSQFDFGFSGSRGNTEVVDIRAAFLTIRETESDRWKIDASYFYGETEGEKSTSRFTAGALKDWLFPESPWLYFAQGRYDYDEFKDWTHRVSGHGGVGYEFIKTEDFTLVGRAGAGAAREWKPSSDIRPEGLLGGDLVWDINDSQRLTAHTTIYPELDDLFEFRLVSGITWTMAIDHARGIALNFGLDNEYQSRTDDDSEHNDLKFYGGISIGF